MTTLPDEMLAQSKVNCPFEGLGYNLTVGKPSIGAMPVQRLTVNWVVTILSQPDDLLIKVSV